MAKKSKRLYILSNSDIKETFGFPRFNVADREFYISVGEDEARALQSYRTAKSKAHFILLSAYFKATGLLHHFNFEDVARDTEYLLKIGPKNFKKGELSDEVRKCEEYGLLYGLAKEIIPELELSGRAVKYYVG